jgi:hypothetical protein
MNIETLRTERLPTGVGLVPTGRIFSNFNQRNGSLEDNVGELLFGAIMLLDAFLMGS